MLKTVPWPAVSINIHEERGMRRNFCRLADEAIRLGAFAVL